jgi:SET domain-containing protein
MARKRPFRIGRSRTGLGLFATEPIRKRARIVEYKGRKLPNDQAEKLEARGNRYLYEINSRWTIDGSTRGNLGRYANHSCRPNAEPGRPPRVPACDQGHQAGRRDHLRLRHRLPQQRDHSSRMQM